MTASFERCVRAIAGLIAEENGVIDPETRKNVENFILATCSRAPDHIRIGLFLSTMMFDAAPLLRFAKPFHRLGTERRREQLHRWDKARFNGMRSVATFYRSLATFACASLQTDHKSAAPAPASSEERRAS